MCIYVKYSIYIYIYVFIPISSSWSQDEGYRCVLGTQSDGWSQRFNQQHNRLFPAFIYIYIILANNQFWGSLSLRCPWDWWCDVTPVRLCSLQLICIMHLVVYFHLSCLILDLHFWRTISASEHFSLVNINHILSQEKRVKSLSAFSLNNFF